jgi:hypothetical protein
MSPSLPPGKERGGAPRENPGLESDQLIALLGDEDGGFKISQKKLWLKKAPWPNPLIRLYNMKILG